MKRLIAVISKSLLLVSFLNSFSLFAATPTMEGLFRNGANADIGGELVILRLQVEEKSNDLLMERLKVEGNEQKLSELLQNEKMPAKYIELILSPDSSKGFEAVMNEYSNRTFSENAIWRSEYLSSFNSKIKKEGRVGRNMLYSAVMMLALNDADPMVKLIKSYNKDFELNREVMNSDKISLLKRYQKYLSLVKDDKEIRNELESPMNPTDEAKKQQVVGLEKARMYRASSEVKLIRENALFFWMIELEKFQARFFNDTHQLDFLKMNVGDGQVELNCSDYILFEGRFRLPRYFMLKDINDRLYKISFLGIKSYSKSSVKLTERQQKFAEKIVTKNVVAPLTTDIIF